MLIDRLLPHYDATEVQEAQVNAAPDMTYAAIRETDLRDPFISALFAVRELPNRLARRIGGEPPGPTRDAFTFGNLTTPDMGWVLLGEEPGVEFVVGSVGRFWKRDYGWQPVAADRFAAFDEPGYARLRFALSPAACISRTMRLRPQRTAWARNSRCTRRLP